MTMVEAPARCWKCQGPLSLKAIASDHNGDDYVCWRCGAPPEPPVPAVGVDRPPHPGGQRGARLTGASRLEQLLMNALRRHGALTKSSALAACGTARWRSIQVQRVLAELERDGVVVRESVPGRHGRPVCIWRFAGENNSNRMHDSDSIHSTV